MLPTTILAVGKLFFKSKSSPRVTGRCQVTRSDENLSEVSYKWDLVWNQYEASYLIWEQCTSKCFLCGHIFRTYDTHMTIGDFYKGGRTTHLRTDCPVNFTFNSGGKIGSCVGSYFRWPSATPFKTSLEPPSSDPFMALVDESWNLQSTRLNFDLHICYYWHISISAFSRENRIKLVALIWYSGRSELGVTPSISSWRHAGLMWERTPK